MDVRTCLSLTLAEAVALYPLSIPKCYRIVLYPLVSSPLRGLPGPKGGNPLFGSLLQQYAASSPVEVFLTWSAEWPDAPLIRYPGFAGQEMLLLNSTQAHKEVLQSHCYSFVKPSFLRRSVGEIIRTGLMFTEKDEHKRQRRIIMNVFSVPNIRKLLPVMHNEAESVINHMAAQVAASGTGDIDVIPVLLKGTLDMIGRTAMGRRLADVRSAETEMNCQQCYERMLGQSPLSALISFIHVHIPIRWAIPHEANRGFVRAQKGLRGMLSQHIAQRGREVETGNAKGESENESRDLLTFMLQERRNTGLLNILAAGHETTSGTLAWSLYVLATRPDVQEKLRAEIERIGTEKLDLATVEGLHYLNIFFQEIVRVHSTVPFTYREAGSDIIICGQVVPKGTQVVICPHVTNLSPRIWGDDAEEFRPERWEHVTGEAASAYSIETFLNGPRVCIGKAYAILEVKVYLIELVRNFRFSRSAELKALGDRPLPMQNPSITCRPRGALRIRIERIKGS
ncbi:cytochrome P450 3A5 [Xylariomycetidae sp. FL0641]|nr:cytochrome P450 3A5 [Xylariomycetidae sp. FL0641]